MWTIYGAAHRTRAPPLMPASKTGFVKFLALCFGSLVAASAFALYANASVPPVAYTKVVSSDALI